MMGLSGRIWPAFAGLIAAVSLAGCGDSLYQAAPVTGTVLCDGKPATGGVVVFQPADAPKETGRPEGEPGLTSTGIVGEDGTFTLMVEARGFDSPRTGALIGPHHVFFRPPRTTPWELDPSDRALPPEQLAKLKEELAKRPVYKPLACGDRINPDTTTVKAGKNSFQFTLAAPTPNATAAKPRKRAYTDTFQYVPGKE
ncbi:MAG TPA: hypothetical protein VL475_00115 [Planctomycetaceae bacterium]|jgi:hypothetical protein|nr:hypothetical protein [Planctomycetaceae bacterium]